MGMFFAKLLSTFFFVGLVKKAPGTFGTLAGLLVIYPVIDGLSFSQFQYLIYLTFLIGTIATHAYMTRTGRSDPKEVVIDEVVGVWICLAIIKYFAFDLPDYLIFTGSFVLFRFFDILKPFPISYIDKKMDNALGVMLDDILAGIAAGVSLAIIVQIFL